MKNSKFVDVNGAQVLDLTPNHDRALALVDFEIVKRLSSYLPIGDLYDVKRDMINSIHQAETLEDYLKLLEEEVAFHRTINLLQSFYLQDAEEEMERGL